MHIIQRCAIFKQKTSDARNLLCWRQYNIASSRRKYYAPKWNMLEKAIFKRNVL